MKKINYVYLMLVLVFFSLVSSGRAWWNQPEGAVAAFEYTGPTSRNEGAYNDHLRRGWSDYLYQYDFSSHDWIALEALKLVKGSLFSSLWQDDLGNPFWGDGSVNDRRQKIFLYATAGPDMGGMIHITTSGGQDAKAPGRSAQHYYYFDDLMNPREDSLGRLAYSCAQSAVTAIRHGDCDTGAFFLGALTHYIADACLWFHVSDSLEDHYSSFEKYTSTRMRYNTLSSLFTIYMSPLLVFPEPPDVGTRIVASRTFFGVGTGLDYDADWLHATWFNVIPRYQKGLVHIRDDWSCWQDEPYPVSEGYWFFKTMEDRVNDAVWHTANAMTWVMEEVGTYKCKGGLDESQTRITKFFNIGAAFMLMSYLGVFLLEYVMKAVVIKI